MKTLDDLDVEGKKVLVRVDFNVPLKDGAVTDDTRIRGALPTLRELLDRGAALVLVSHLGRPKDREPELSLRPVADRLSELIGTPVKLAPGIVGDQVTALANDLRKGEILLLENVRYEPGRRRTTPRWPTRWRRSPTSTSTTPSAPPTARMPPPRASRDAFRMPPAGCWSAR